MRDYNPDNELYKRLIIRVALIIVFILLLTLVLPKILKLLYPFILALILATLLNPFVSKIHKSISKSNIRFVKARKPITLILNIAILIIVSSLLFLISYVIVREIISFSISIQQNWSEIVIKFNEFSESFQWLLKLLPVNLTEALGGLKDNILELAHNAIKKVLASMLSRTGSVITGTGTFLINLITFFLAMYFLISDYHIIGDFASRHSDRPIFKTCRILKDSVFNALGGYFKAQIILASFAFVFMLISLMLYGQSHALIIALILGIIDLLPFIGTNIVLLPWGLIEFVSGSTHKGVFLIVIGVVFFLIRRIIEPKIMGSQTGLHPLWALLSTYIGLKLSGVWGAILGPLVLIVIIRIFKSGIFDNIIYDFKIAFSNMTHLFKNQKNI